MTDMGTVHNPNAKSRPATNPTGTNSNGYQMQASKYSNKASRFHEARRKAGELTPHGKFVSNKKSGARKSYNILPKVTSSYSLLNSKIEMPK